MGKTEETVVKKEHSDAVAAPLQSPPEGAAAAESISASLQQFITAEMEAPIEGTTIESEGEEGETSSGAAAPTKAMVRLISSASKLDQVYSEDAWVVAEEEEVEEEGTTAAAGGGAGKQKALKKKSATKKGAAPATNEDPLSFLNQTISLRGLKQVPVAQCIVVPLIPRFHGAPLQMAEQVVPILMDARNESALETGLKSHRWAFRPVEAPVPRDEQEEHSSSWNPLLMPPPFSSASLQPAAPVQEVTSAPSLKADNLQWRAAMKLGGSLMNKNFSAPPTAAGAEGGGGVAAKSRRKSKSNSPAFSNSSSDGFGDLITVGPRAHQVNSLVGGPHHGTAAAMIEWGDGTITMCHDKAGLDAEQHSRETHYLHLLPTTAEATRNRELAERCYRSNGESMPAAPGGSGEAPQAVKDVVTEVVAGRDVQERSRLQLARLRETFSVHVPSTQEKDNKTKREAVVDGDSFDNPSKRKKFEQGSKTRIKKQNKTLVVPPTLLSAPFLAPMAPTFVSTARPRMHLYSVGYQHREAASTSEGSGGGGGATTGPTTTASSYSSSRVGRPTGSGGSGGLAPNAKALVQVGGAALEFLIHFEGHPHHNRFCTVGQIIDLFKERRAWEAEHNHYPLLCQDDDAASSINGNKKKNMTSKKTNNSGSGSGSDIVASDNADISVIPDSFQRTLAATAVTALQSLLRDTITRLLLIVRCGKRRGGGGGGSTLKGASVLNPQVLEAIIWYEQQQPVAELLKDLCAHGLFNSAVKEEDLMPRSFWEGHLPQWEEARLTVLSNGRLPTYTELMARERLVE